MNWEAMGAIGEVVGAVGVIVSLLYLALQIRQSSNVTRSATRQAISTTQIELVMRIAENPDLRATIGRWYEDGSTPMQDDDICDFMLRRAMLRAYENQYHQFKYGTFDADMWNTYSDGIKSTLLSAKGRAWWEMNRSQYSSDFVSFVEHEILVGSDTGKSDSNSRPK